MLRCQYAQQRRLEKAVISLFPVRSEIIAHPLPLPSLHILILITYTGRSDSLECNERGRTFERGDRLFPRVGYLPPRP